MEMEEDAGSDSGEEDTITLTAKELLLRLRMGWMNEKLSPELQFPMTDEINIMLEQIGRMETQLGDVDKLDIRTGIHRLEVERLRYICVSYMRTRLFKIQTLARYYYDMEIKNPSPGEISFLMPEEFKFLKKFIETEDEYLNTVVSSNLPQPLQKIEPKLLLELPKLDSYVFFRTQENNNILVKDAEGMEHQVNLQAGDQHIMRYQPVSFLLRKETVNLV